jgi:LPS O-antigen subunit length determinant protein (WzzB/FepE family)
MSNNHIIDATKDFFNLLKINFKLIIASSLFFLILGIIFSFSLSPKFEVYAEILPKEDDNFAMQQNNSLLSMLSQNNQRNDLSFFQSKMYSSAVAKTLWEMGYDKIFFSDLFNERLNLYQSQPTSWQQIKSKILGYEINTIIDHQNLSDFIEDTFTLKTYKKSPSNFLITLQQNPQAYLGFLQDLMRVTDDEIKRDKLIHIESRIQFLTEKIRTTKEVTVQNNLMLLLERTLLEEVLLSDESYYSILVVDEPQISKNPSFINLQFIYFGFLLLGFFISIIYLYIKKFFFNSSL